MVLYTYYTGYAVKFSSMPPYHLCLIPSVMLHCSALLSQTDIKIHIAVVTSGTFWCCCGIMHNTHQRHVSKPNTNGTKYNHRRTEIYMVLRERERKTINMCLGQITKTRVCLRDDDMLLLLLLSLLRLSWQLREVLVVWGSWKTFWWSTKGWRGSTVEEAVVEWRRPESNNWSEWIY